MIIITGASGFIGSIVAKEISKIIRNQKLVLVDKFTKPNKWKNILGFKYYDFIDRDFFINNLEIYKNQIKTIVHLGACTNTMETDVNYLMQTNYEYSKTLCKFSLENNIKFIYASSASVYGNGEHGFKDDDSIHYKFKPLNPYAFSKWLFDNWIIENNYQDKVIGLRFFNVFGPNEYHKKTMASVIYRAFPMAKEHGLVKLFKSYVSNISDGEQERDFIYVKDVAKVIIFFLNETNKKFGIFNLGTGTARSFNDLAKGLLTALKKDIKIEYIDMPIEIRNKYQYYTVADLNKLRRAGYKEDFTSLETAIKEYVSIINKT